MGKPKLIADAQTRMTDPICTSRLNTEIKNFDKENVGDRDALDRQKELAEFDAEEKTLGSLLT